MRIPEIASFYKRNTAFGILEKTFEPSGRCEKQKCKTSDDATIMSVRGLAQDSDAVSESRFSIRQAWLCIPFEKRTSKIGEQN
ncbi:hypothetical protein DI09_125p10 [Mitosporidium daphniae]|uniref:Uncharacterized protein n=1 Tax=Mitosporidium daphniae TaxID=1485682 RepID=A0A098VYX2_9MICR|nr:uncharacterized protein DI09_125p10 [Mitosporidium daphniae]KGG52911.1 hypothetical protein DI09_125p10 [Mitosporidium daphniae]|eukprot:XP_013239347.1 uncharacterized protein DI09_125p10 [Mitosporidium daphniae]